MVVMNNDDTGTDAINQLLISVTILYEIFILSVIFGDGYITQLSFYIFNANIKYIFQFLSLVLIH